MYGTEEEQKASEQSIRTADFIAVTPSLRAEVKDLLGRPREEQLIQIRAKLVAIPNHRRTEPLKQWLEHWQGHLRARSFGKGMQQDAFAALSLATH